MKETERAAQEAERRLTALMAQYKEPLLRMCGAYLRDAALAEDAVQETFVKAYRGLGDFRGQSGEKTWLMRIAINTCKDFRRAAWFRYVDRRITPEKLPPPAVQMEAWQGELSEMVMKLPPKYLEVVLLYYYQGMSSGEVAQALSLPRRTVTERLTRARARLRIVLEGGKANEQT